jgi:8-oxo-dGTP diphosphatase
VAPEADPSGSIVADNQLIRAAGCVLWRRAGRADSGVLDGTGGVEVALVHRPRYDDWSHPKGKLHDGESPAEAAVREVLEETGMHCVLGLPLPTASYVVRGRAKVVSYWAAEAVAGVFAANDEVDQLRWLPPEQARHRLSNPADRLLLDAAAASWWAPGQSA